MLSERKRFSYINSTGLSGGKKPMQEYTQPTSLLTSEDRNIQQLQRTNKQILQNTAKQFRQLEADVQRVEAILQDKEQLFDVANRQGQTLKTGLDRTQEENKLLIEAIFDKDQVIQQLQLRLQEMIQQREIKGDIQEQEKVREAVVDGCCQSEQQKMQNCCMELIEERKAMGDLEQEIYILKEQLYDASSKLKLAQQQFSAFKLLRDIQKMQQS